MSNEVESLQQKFTEFLKTFKDVEGVFKYEDRIKQMIIERRKSIVVDYEDIVKFDVKLFEVLIERPEEGLYAFSEAIRDIVREFDEEYASSVSRFTPRLNGLPTVITLRELSNEHINKLIMIEGILVRATPPKQKMYKATYAHILPTGEVHEFEWPPIPSDEIGDELERPAYCPLCKDTIVSDKSRGFSRGTFKLIVEKSRYRNWQKVVLQERPEEVPAGHIPRSIEVILTDDIVDIARPGDRVSIIGIVKLLRESRRKGAQPIFNTYIEANNVIVAQRFLEELKLSKEDEEMIRKLGKDPLIRRKIICSIAPSIYGLWDIKEAIALQLFGGVPKVAPDGTKVRGDIHILIVGDPGTAKSQLLQYVARIAPRGLYTTGKGSSAAGLCVGGDTLLYSSEGLIPMRDLVEDNLNKLRIWDGVLISSDPKPVEVVSYLDGNVGYSRTSQYYMLWSDKVVEIKTSLGLNLITTPETNVLVYDNGRILWKSASLIRRGDYLVVVRKLPESEVKVNILDILPDDLYLKISKELVNTIMNYIVIRYGSLSKFLSTGRMSKYKFYRLLRKGVIRLYDLKYLVKTLNIDYNSLDTYVSEVGCRGFKGMYWVKLPVVDKDFIKFLANLYTRSSVITNKRFEPVALRYRINSDEDMEYLISNLRRFFLPSNSSLSYRVCRGEAGRYVVVKNRLLSLLISSWGVSNTINKSTSRLISSLSKDYLVLLIRELVKNSGFVGEGYIRISLTTKASAILLNMMLRRFGILSSIDELGSEYRLVINDLKSFKIFLREVLGCEEYSKDNTLTNDGNYLEISDELSAVMVTDVVEGRGQAVYDLTIDGTHSFIANGFIVHNTAAVIKEKQSGEYFLEAGAMVLADGGIVCIDEIDKMRDEDRVAIHEAMEQGTVSIAKAGIVARLNARASVLAAGNPKYGRYIPSRPIAENINLPITILSRFDLIFTLRDLTDVERDKSLVRHVLRTHEAIEEVRPEIPPDILRKYVAYARKYVKPRLTRDAELLIEEFYLEMRRKSAEVPEAPIAITTRQLEALIRLAEAHARMALKSYVDVEDAAEAIRLMNVILENVGIDVETGQIDIDVIMTGKPKSIRDKELIIKDVIKELSSEEGCAKIKDIVREAVKKGIDEDFVEKYITSLRRAGELYEVRAGCVNFVE